MIVLWATHLVDEAEKSDKVIILDKGKIINSGSPQEIKLSAERQNLHDAFVKLTSQET